MTHTYCTQIMELVERRLSRVEQANGTWCWDEAACRTEALLERKLQKSWERMTDHGQPPSLEYLLRVFDLSRFERHCVYFALAPELDGVYENRFAAQNSRNVALPTLELCLETFPAARSDRTELLTQWHADKTKLSYFFRLDRQTQHGQLSGGLKLDGRVTDFLFDVMSQDPVLEGKTKMYWPGDREEAPFLLYEQQLEKMARRCEEMKTANLLFFLKGAPGSGRRTLARMLCHREGRPLLEADLPELFHGVQDLESVLIPLCRETAIRGAALMLTGMEKLMGEQPAPDPKEDADKNDPTDWKPTLRLLLERLAGVTDRLFLLSEEGWETRLSPAPWYKAELELDTPNTAGRMLLWQHYLKDIPMAEGVSVESTAIKFGLNPGQIAAAAGQAKQLADWEGEAQVSEELLRRACRSQLSHNLGKMASRVNTLYTWDDLILPPYQKGMLKNACAQVEQQHRVYDQWGFGKKVAYGRGVSMLFSGPPGTGKTMAAQVIANRLGLELYKVDLSGIMSKYVGETEKQLGVVFDEVKKSQSILFFDEADAMFGKRTETKDSHDQYANVQTSYLLQKMEEYDGIVILASNFLQNFDEAFKRRLKFIIEFTLPDREHREQIWRSVLPPELPLEEDLDFDFLARSFELSGSSIKNIAVAAAFLAAEEDVPVGMAHLLTATQAEQNKAGKNVGQEELGEYYHQVQAYQAIKNGRSE